MTLKAVREQDGRQVADVAMTAGIITTKFGFNLEISMEGTLVVDMFDSATKELLWRGSASGTVSSKSDKNIKNLDKGVQKMFKNYPPKA